MNAKCEYPCGKFPVSRRVLVSMSSEKRPNRLAQERIFSNMARAMGSSPTRYSALIIQKEPAGVEIPIRYRHRRTGAVLETKIANFWTFEEGWPVKLSEYHDISRIQAFTASMAALAQR